MIITLYKPIGKTPLEVINDYKEKNDSIKKCSYAGRLDPMASGLLVVLINQSCSLQNEFHNLSKVYEFKIALGISTDSYDLLGKVTCVNMKEDYNIKELSSKIIDKFVGTQKQKYPSYSSIRVNGKPLWYHALHNKLEDIEIPEKTINISNIVMLDNYKLTKEEFKEIINSRINSVNK